MLAEGDENQTMKLPSAWSEAVTLLYGRKPGKRMLLVG
jgi:hypothetical protein